jgi:hypothetical protein
LENGNFHSTPTNKEFEADEKYNVYIYNVPTRSWSGYETIELMKRFPVNIKNYSDLDHVPYFVGKETLMIYVKSMRPPLTTPHLITFKPTETFMNLGMSIMTNNMAAVRTSKLGEKLAPFNFIC